MNDAPDRATQPAKTPGIGARINRIPLRDAMLVGVWLGLYGSFFAWTIAMKLPLSYIAYVGLLLTASACYGRWLRVDPVAFASVVGLAIAVATIGVVARPDLPIPQLAYFWLGAWMVAGGRLWPWWRLHVLGRLRPGTPEREVLDAQDRIWTLLRAPWTTEIWDAVHREARALDTWITPNTLPTTNAIRSWISVVGRGTREDADRVYARWGDEVGRMQRAPVLRLGPRAEESSRRPTAGTSLEYEYPRLEALLALGDEREQRRMRIGAARMALESTGLLSPDRISMLEAGLKEAPSPAQIDSLSDDQRAVAALWQSEATDEAKRQHAREWHALESVDCAIRPLVWPLDAADAVYEAAQALPNMRNVRVIEDMATGILGPERAAQAEEIPFKPVPQRVVDPEKLREGWTWVARIRTTRRTVCQLVVLGFVVGTGAKVLGQVAAAAGGRLADPYDIDRLVKIVAIGIGLAIVAKTRAGRVSFADLMLAIVGPGLAFALATPIGDGVRYVFDTVDPAIWPHLYFGSTSVLPFAPIYGLATAATLLIAHFATRALYLRVGPGDSPAHRAPGVIDEPRTAAG